MTLEQRTQTRYRRRVNVGNPNHHVRIADGYRAELDVFGIDAQRIDAVCLWCAHRQRPWLEIRSIHFDGHQIAFAYARVDGPAWAAHRDFAPERRGTRIQQRGDATGAIAALLDLGAIGVKNTVKDASARIAGRFEHQRLIETDPGMPVRDRAQRGTIDALIVCRHLRVEDEEIVAETLHLHELDPHGLKHSRSVTRLHAMVKGLKESLMRVSVANSDRSFSAGHDQSVLDAALCAGLNLPHSCKSGNCGSCRARLLEGQIVYPHGKPLGLCDAELDAGFILLCQARACGDLLIETSEIRPTHEITVRRLPCRIERAIPLSHDVMAVFLRLPVAEEFHFDAGQYIDVMLSGGRRRSFSIASPPHASRLLELHVRRVAGGEFTEQLFTGQPQHMLLTIEGPLGQFVHRPTGAPILMVGGGTGLAPLLCMLRHVIETGIRRDIRLYWGVRGERDLYADATLAELSRTTAGFRYVPVLSVPTAAWGGRRGFVHEAVLQDHAHLQSFDIYASGPPAMIEAVRREFEARGARPAHLYFDSFAYAPDTLERQRTSASTSA
jgi:CDP-4-dehydro-6-deoxyglucose reductase